MNDAEFLSRFEDCSLPRTEWTHRAHVKVAFLYLRDRSLEQAIHDIRLGIQAYKASQGVEEGPTSGYNETTTLAFVHLVAATMAAYGGAISTPDADAFCDAHPQLMTRHVLRFFYSPERRLHRDSKSYFVEPDLAPLPTIVERR